MSNFRKFCISGGLFNGFETLINLETAISNEDIIQTVINNLHVTLQSMFNLQNSLDEEKSKYHIHGTQFEEILSSNNDEIFYVCNHC